MSEAESPKYNRTGRRELNRRGVLKTLAAGGVMALVGGAGFVGSAAAAPVEITRSDLTGGLLPDPCTGEDNYWITGGFQQVVARDLSEDKCLQDRLVAISLRNVTAVDESGTLYRVAFAGQQRIKGDICAGPVVVTEQFVGNIIEVGSGAHEPFLQQVKFIITASGDLVVEREESTCPPAG